jgi:hypothetical protein
MTTKRTLYLIDGVSVPRRTFYREYVGADFRIVTL